MKELLNSVRFFWLVVAIVIALGCTIYRFRHPDLTETQLILHLWPYGLLAMAGFLAFVVITVKGKY